MIGWHQKMEMPQRTSRQIKEINVMPPNVMAGTEDVPGASEGTNLTAIVGKSQQSRQGR